MMARKHKSGRTYTPAALHRARRLDEMLLEYAEGRWKPHAKARRG